MKYKNNFVIHSTKQLIDINKGLKDFTANISITSQNKEDEFDIVIVTQQNLDNIEFSLNYRRVNHYINVDVESSESDDNDYVLVIKADQKTNVDIEIDLIDNKTPYHQPPQPPQHQPQPQPQPPQHQPPQHKPQPPQPQQSSFEYDMNKIQEELNELEDIDEIDYDNDEQIMNEIDENDNLQDIIVDKNIETYKKPISKNDKVVKKYKFLNKKVFIFIGIGILACLCLYYLFFTKPKKKKTKEDNFNKNDIEDNLEMNNNNNEEKSSSTTSKKRVKSSKKKESVEMTNESLLEQLRKIRQEDD